MKSANDMAETLKRLKTSRNGLTNAEAAQRLKTYGKNQIVDKKVSPIVEFLGFFVGPIPFMIEAAAVLSLLAGHYPDFVAIVILLFINTAVGFGEEKQATDAVESLKKQLAQIAQVKRDGSWQNLGTADLVPGDIIHVKMGDIVPADAYLISGNNLELDQSSLTGESLPVDIDAGDKLSSSAIVSRGYGDAVVFATGRNTTFGHAAELVKNVNQRSHFQQAIVKIGNYLIVLALAMIILINIVALLRHTAVLNTLEFSLVLLVAAIPVAMPTILSITMAIGAKQLAKKQAIVTRLAAIEELAGIDILCSDKTGTLTLNQLTTYSPICFNNFTADEVMRYAALTAKSDNPSPIDEAILNNMKDVKMLNQFRVTSVRPFDSGSKCTEIAFTDQRGRATAASLGATEVIDRLTGGDQATALQNVVDRLAGKGYRTIALAVKKDSGDWKLAGLIPIYDPLRPDAVATIREARRNGVDVKVITGDHSAIAKETTTELGLGGNIANAKQLQEAAKSPENFAKIIKEANGFAEVLPEQKFNILKSLQKSHHIVGMTGDGVNDAAALKEADCGIAVYGATDAAKSAASIVLLKPGLGVIVDAIRQSRIIFARMNSYAIYRIAETIRILIFMTLAIIVFNFYPVTPIMIILIALMNDGAIITIAYDNMKGSRAPAAWNMRRVLTIATSLGLAGVVSTFGLLLLNHFCFHLDNSQVQTLIYLKLSVAGHLTIFLTRTRGPFYSTKPNKLLVGAVLVTQLLATAIAIGGFMMSPLNIWIAVFVWVYAIAWFLVNDCLKLWVYKKLDAKSA